MGEVNTAYDLRGALAVYDEHRTKVLELVNIHQRLTIKHGGLALLTKDEC